MNVGYACGLCPDGMVGNGVHCSRTDPCVSNPCYPGATCTMVNIPIHSQDSNPEVTTPVSMGKFRNKIWCFGANKTKYNNKRNLEIICWPLKCCLGNPSYVCGPCPHGLIGDGYGHGCRLPHHPCESNPCHPGVACGEIGGHDYECGDCPEGTTGDGVLCTGTKLFCLFS